MVNHGHHLRADGSFILFNNGSSLDASAVVRAFKLNTTDMTATSTLTYMAGIASLVMGDAQFLPSREHPGDVLAVRAIHEVTSGGQLAATFKATSFGYTEYRDSLYGPPPR